MEVAHKLRLLQLAHNTVFSLIFIACAIWVSWWLVSSEPPVDLAAPFDAGPFHSTPFFGVDGTYGDALFFQSGPFVVVAMLSFAMIEIKKRIKWLEGGLKRDQSSRKISYPSIATYPLIVRSSPLGVLTAAEVLFIAAILILVGYSFGREYHLAMKLLSVRRLADPATINQIPMGLYKLAHIAFFLARSGMIPFALLWIPVSRGSPFLRLINMPFEHAVKYHIWLAKLAITMFTLHGILKSIDYIGVYQPHAIIGWDVRGENVSVLAGVVALVAVLVMWATSLASFRKKWFEVFFGFHHLYFLVFLTFLYHTPWTVHIFIVPFLLFVVDRFLRMVQSQRSVDVISAKLLESGAIEIKLAKSKLQGLTYHALSCWYFRFSSLSRFKKLEWHFFSATSTQMAEKEELSLIIKPLGKWTKALRDKLFKDPKFLSSGDCPFSFKAGVEGPYGDESDFFLEYKVLVLVSGGIGITPMLALLRDVLHRYRRGERDLPTCIYFYHCTRELDELSVLNNVDPRQILPNYESCGLQIRVFAYVTSRSKKDYNNMIDLSDFTNHKQPINLSTFAVFHGGCLREVVFSKRGQGNRRSISSISTKGKTVWVASTMLASIFGFYLLWGILNKSIVGDNNPSFTNYNRIHLAVGSLFLGVFCFGGVVVLSWWQRVRWVIHNSTKKVSDMYEEEQASIEEASYTKSAALDKATVRLKQGSPWEGLLYLCSRPSWREIFIGINKEYEGEDIGVLVSGGLGLQEAIAEECRLNTKLVGRDACSNTFHFHPTSFEL